MKTMVPHNVLTISEMTRRSSRMNSELIDVDSLVLDDDTIKKLRASSSMFNKSTYVQILFDGVRYNVESVGRKGEKYCIRLISPRAIATLSGHPDSGAEVVKFRAL